MYCWQRYKVVDELIFAIMEQVDSNEGELAAPEEEEEDEKTLSDTDDDEEKEKKNISTCLTEYRKFRKHSMIKFKSFNPVQRLQFLHEMTNLLYPPERVVMRSHLEGDVSFFRRKRNPNKIYPGAESVAEYINHCNPRLAILFDAHIRSALSNDVAALEWNDTSTALKIFEFIQNAHLLEVNFQGNSCLLMEVMTLVEYSLRHPAFTLKMKQELEKISKSLEMQYFTDPSSSRRYLHPFYKIDIRRDQSEPNLHALLNKDSTPTKKPRGNSVERC